MSEMEAAAYIVIATLFGFAVGGAIAGSSPFWRGVRDGLTFRWGGLWTRK